jgi:hypothetical protein
MVFVAAIGLGVGLAYLLNKLRPVFNHRAELEAFTGVPVLGEVSLTTLNDIASASQRSHLLFSAGAIGLAVACIAALILQSRVY